MTRKNSKHIDPDSRIKIINKDYLSLRKREEEEDKLRIIKHEDREAQLGRCEIYSPTNPMC